MDDVDNVVPSASKLWAARKCLCRRPFLPSDAHFFSPLEASKEWVIPAKPKPGRKPKKDTNGPVDEDTEVCRLVFVPSIPLILMWKHVPRVTPPFGGTATGKRLLTENASPIKKKYRAAQRAFRERKQSQLAELQARIQAHEQGETERLGALQNLARKYKEENEQLRVENAALRQRVAQLEAEKLATATALYQPRKRAASVNDTVPVQFAKRTKTAAGSLSALISAPISYPPSPSSTSSIESYPSPTFEVNPVPYHIAPPETSLFSDYRTEGNTLVSTSPADDTDSPFQRFDCGFCDENTPCVCREILEQHVADRIGRLGQLTLKVDHLQAPGIASPSTSQAQPSILDNLPAYQPAVPLRRRALNKQTGGGSSIFPIFQPSPLPLTCSGDPRNCRACASDDFGKAFCDAVNNSMAASEAAGAMDISEDSPPKSSAEAESEKQAMVPCDDAWRQLKSHPNVEFSDLNLLADVVARRSKCTGPRVVISPPLGSVTPERGATPFFPSSGPPGLPEFSGDSILDTRDGTAVGEHRRVGVREVPREALQAAMDLLDAKTKMSLS